MNYSNYSFTLDLQIHQSQISIPVSLNDTARKLYITFIDGRKPYTIPDGCRAIFVGFKPDGATLFNDCIIQENKTVIYEFTEQTANVEGIVNCEIRLYGKDGKQLTSSQFIMIVDENVTRDISLSENESTAIDNIIHAEIGRVEAEAERAAAEKIRNAAEEKRIETEEEIKELANVLKPLAPFILQSPYLDDLDRPCYILDIGKEYKGEAEEVIPHSLVGYFTGGEGSAYSPYIFAEKPIKEFTIKIIGFEGSILTYEYNGEIRTYDCSVNSELTPPYELQRVDLVWRGDLYLCNPEGIKGGEDGKDGKTPYIKDGNWWIGDTDTGVKAEGKDGKDGEKGDKGDKGDQGIQGEKGEKGDKGDQGIQGIQGIQGEQGEKGDKGDKGDAGADGKDGTNGKDGADGTNGKDGVSATHSWNGTTLTITSASGTSSADLKGADGKDYVLTEADTIEIATKVVEMFGGNPIFGIVDEKNNIILSGNLADGDYTVKYEMEDGSTVGIGNLVLDTNVYYSVTNNLTNCTNNNNITEVTEGESYSATISANSGYELKSVTVTMGGESVAVTNGVINIANVTGDIVITAVAEEQAVIPTYTNLIPISTDDNGNLLVGTNGEKGYKTNTRLSISAGGETTSDAEGCEVTGYIPAQAGDILRIKNITTGSGGKNVLLFYDADKKKKDSDYTATVFSIDEGNGVFASSGLRNVAGMAYIRFASENIDETSIVTKNEEIA